MDYRQTITAALEGDSEAFGALYEATYSDMYYIAQKYMKNSADAEDVLQDSYVKAFRGLSSLRDPASFPGWLGRIVANTAKNMLARKNPILFSEIEGENDEGDTYLYDVEDDNIEYQPELNYTRQETQELVREMIGSLSDEQRMCILMFYLDNQSIRDIAQTFSISENTVKSRLNYGRKALKKRAEELEKKGYKLYSTAALPLLLYLLRTERDSAEHTASAKAAMQAGMQKNSALFGNTHHIPGAAQTGRAVGPTAGRTAAKTTAKFAAKKWIIAAVATAGIGTGGAAVLHYVNDNPALPSVQREAGQSQQEHLETETTVHIETETTAGFPAETTDDPGTQIETVPQTEQWTEAASVPPTETSSELIIETETELITETETETELFTETESETELITETETETELLTETETESELLTETETESELLTEAETESEALTETETVPDILIETEVPSETQLTSETRPDIMIESETPSGTVPDILIETEAPSETQSRPESISGIVIQSESPSETQPAQETAADWKIMTDKDYPLLIAGGLSKEELEFVLAEGPQDIPEGGIQDADIPGYVNKLCMASYAETVSGKDGYIEYYGTTQNYEHLYSADDVNRLLASFTDFTFTEENYGRDKGQWIRVEDGKLIFCPATPSSSSTAVITSAKYSGKAMVVYFTIETFHDEWQDPVTGEWSYNVTTTDYKIAHLVPNEYGKYRIDKIVYASAPSEAEQPAGTNQMSEIAEAYKQVLQEVTSPDSEYGFPEVPDSTDNCIYLYTDTDGDGVSEYVLEPADEGAGGTGIEPFADPASHYQYFLHDVDGDGVQELIVGKECTVDVVFLEYVCHIYTFQQTETGASVVKFRGNMFSPRVPVEETGFYYASYSRGTGETDVYRVTTEESAISVSQTPIYEFSYDSTEIDAFYNNNPQPEWTAITDYGPLEAL